MQWGATLLAGLAGFVIARVLLPLRLRRPPEALVRINVDGDRVPAVLAEPLLGSGLVVLGGVALAGVIEPELDFPRMALGVAIVTVVLGIAGRWDDLRGDESARGFKGHLRAAGGGALTGGVVKIVAGAASGLAAGALVADGWAVLEVGVLVALAANLVNLLDRAPGRAAKVTVTAGVLLIAFGRAPWALGGAGILGALVACVPPDLRARAMLGDAAANPLGGLVGLGLAASLGRPGRLVTIAVLVLLNALSERYSFSRAIERVAWLRALDRLGRDREK